MKLSVKKIKIKPADEKEALKLLLTWAKRNKILNTFKIAITMMQDFSFHSSINPQRKTEQEIAMSLFYSAHGTEENFVEVMNNWKAFIKVNGTKWRPTQTTTGN
jgi:hypothetical protein